MLETIIVPICITTILALIAKVFPKKKLIEKITPICKLIAKSIETILFRFLPPSVEEKFEEGIIITLLELIGQGTQIIINELRLNNKRKNECPKKK